MKRPPERTCVGCRRRRPQPALVRCVVDANGQLTVNRTGAGRGAWLCPPPGDCFDVALRRNAFARAWRQAIEPSALGALREQWIHDEKG